MAKKLTLKEIQGRYSKKLEDIKLRANEENVLLRERLAMAKQIIADLEKQLKDK